MVDPEQVLVVFINCPDHEEARDIALALVEEGAAAAVNLTRHETVYRWEGMVIEGAEVRLIAKTTRRAYPAIEALVQARSSYLTPCIVAWPVELGSTPYLDWVRQEVK